MPQENQVLRCFSCNMFQVHIVKKDKKWQCKICNKKQSVKRVYGRGSGKDCRMHVMKLNELQFTKQVNPDDIEGSENGDDGNCGDADNNTTCEQIEASSPVTARSESKWSSYMKEVKEDDEEEKEMGEFDMMERRVNEMKKNGQKRRTRQEGGVHIKKKKYCHEDTIKDVLSDDCGNNAERTDVHDEIKPNIKTMNRSVMAQNENKFVKSGNNSKWTAFTPDKMYDDDDDDDDDDDIEIDSRNGMTGTINYALVDNNKCVNIDEEGDEPKETESEVLGVEKACMSVSSKVKSSHFNQSYVENEKGKLSMFDGCSGEELNRILDF